MDYCELCDSSAAADPRPPPRPGSIPGFGNHLNPSPQVQAKRFHVFWVPVDRRPVRKIEGRILPLLSC